MLELELKAKGIPRGKVRDKMARREKEMRMAMERDRGRLSQKMLGQGRVVLLLDMVSQPTTTLHTEIQHTTPTPNRPITTTPHNPSIPLSSPHRVPTSHLLPLQAKGPRAPQ